MTVREIAAAAGASPGLITHHDGSKDGLKDAMDRRAVAFFEETIGEPSRIGEQGGSASLAGLFVGRLESEPAMTPSVRRVPHAQDERVQTTFMLAKDLSVVLLRGQIARASGTDPLIREALAAWTGVHRRCLRVAGDYGKA